VELMTHIVLYHETSKGGQGPIWAVAPLMMIFFVTDGYTVDSLFERTRWISFAVLQLIMSWINACRFTNHSPHYRDINVLIYVNELSSAPLTPVGNRTLLPYPQLVRVHARYFNTGLPPTNQPTNQKAKGGVLRKRETSSLARFDHACVRNKLLEMEKVPQNYNGVCAYTNGFIVSA
jgi:hypothetical protein